MDPLNSGSMLGRYEPLVRLGRGGMASVWVARESVGDVQRLLALKAMLPELAHHSDFRSMFLEEGQIIRSIDHPNVVKVHDVGEDRGILFMAMDWVEGDSLRALIQEARRRRPIPAEIAVKIIADAAAGLHAAHELRGWDGELRNVVHCDVSPHNILVGIDGRAKIVDFGVANARLHGDLGGDEKLKGKFSYMSPEQASGRSLDRRSDVFALGIVLYELTTGERLFRGDSPAHTLHLVTEAPIPDPRAVLPEYPEGLARIVRKALERDPEQRFQTADAIREALERYLVEERILVAHASIAQLVRRVLGARIEQLRQNLRETLAARDGVVRAELIPDTPAAIGTFTGVFTGDPPPTPQRQSVYSATPRPQSLEPPAPQRSGLAPLLAAVGGVAAAVSSIVWVMNRPSGPSWVMSSQGAAALPTVSSGDRPASGATPAAKLPDADEPPVESGIDVSAIPLGELPSSGSTPTERRTSGRRAGTKPSRSESSQTPEAPASSATEKSPITPALVDLTTPAPRSQPPPPEEIQLEETPVAETPSAPPGPPQTAEQPEPSPPAGSFNRGAALAALGSLTPRTAGCKSTEGPGGSGRVNVTFSPDGSASRVAVSPPFSGTAVGQCVTYIFQATRIPAFTGSPVTLPWTFRVPE